MDSGFTEILPVLPVAALMVAVARNIAGVVTFGVFTPLLLSVSLGDQSTLFKAGVLLVVFTFGLLTGWVVTKVRLLSVSRMGIIFSVVVLSLSIGIEHLEVPADALVFPFVIVVMMIERFITICEEEGDMKSAITMLAMTVVCSLLILPVIYHEGLQLLMKGNWALQLVNLGALIAVGKYSGYRLTEWWRFRHFIGADGQS